MNTTLKLKLILLVTLFTIAVVTIVPSFYSQTPNWWKTYMAPEGLRLGLDLQGGMHLVLKVNLEKAEENRPERQSGRTIDQRGQDHFHIGKNHHIHAA